MCRKDPVGDYGKDIIRWILREGYHTLDLEDDTDGANSGACAALRCVTQPPTESASSRRAKRPKRGSPVGMDAKAFAKKWDTPLVRLSARAPRPTNVSPAAVQFLAQAGLPEAIAFGDRQNPSQLSFKSLERGLIPLLEALPEGITGPESWAELVVLGEERIEGGASPYWCMHGPTGRVELIDLEWDDDDQPMLVNTSVACLAETLLIFRQWVRLEGSDRDLSRLRADMERVDPVAWPTSQWRMLLDHLESLDVADVICEPDARRRRTRKRGR